ncbi:MAG: alpha/beta hydrolase, partial [Oscillospiraceae bacterium]
MYWITHKQKWFEACIMPMAVTKENISSDIFETAKYSIDYAKIKTGMPSNVKPADIKKCTATTLVLAGEKDCLFPSKRVIPQAEKMIPNCTTYLLKNRGHMNILTDIEKKMIVDFLL